MQHDFILLDRSQSMATRGRWVEALASVNTYVAELAAKGVDTGVTLATFDYGDLKAPGERFLFEVIRDRITPSTWKPVTDADATPRGWTPLYDAIGRIINLAKAGINGQQYDKVAIIIPTDGDENRSQELSHAGAASLIAECRAKGWQVLFIGCDFDNVQQASTLGVAKASTLDSVAPDKMRFATKSMASKREAYGTKGLDMGFSDDEKAELRSKPQS